MTRIYMHAPACEAKNGKICYVKALKTKTHVLGICSVCGFPVEKYSLKEIENGRNKKRRGFGEF